MKQLSIALAVIVSSLFTACSKPDSGSGALALLGEAELRMAEGSPGQTARGTLRVRNEGDASIDLHSTWERGGDVFSLQPGGTVTLEPQQTVELTVIYAPPEDAGAAQHEGTLAIHADGAASGRDHLVIRVTAGTKVSVCDLQQTIDFGIVPVQRTATAGLLLRNTGSAPIRANVGGILDTASNTPFSFGSAAFPGEADLEAGAALTVPLTFTPERAGEFFATMRVRPSAECAEQIVSLTGRAVTAPLRAAPLTLDCGPVPLGLEGSAQLQFFNDALVPVALTGLGPANRTEFRVAEGSDALTVPGATRASDGTISPGTAQIAVHCAPAVLGMRQTNLTFTTDLPSQPEGMVTVRAWGGGPDVELGMTALDFGKVAYFEGAAVGRTIELELRNVGNISPSGSELNLRFASTAFEVVPSGEGTLPGEFMAGLPADYDPAVGISARTGENIVRIPIRFVPQSPGVKHAQLHVFTHDLDEPELIVDLRAEAVVVSACNYSVAPASLDFGRLSMPHERELAVTFRNEGSGTEDVCLLYGAFLTGGGAAGFEVVDQAGPSIEVGPGQERQLRVRFAPRNAPSVPTTVSGTLEVQASSPTSPGSSISTTASAGPGCLVAGPDLVPFGTVKPGCRSESRTVRLYNTCSTPVSLSKVELSQATRSPFSLVSVPSLPASLVAHAAPVTFQVAYAPTGDGDDLGALAVESVENGTPVRYTIALRGRGDVSGVHTDVFETDPQPKLDLLMVIDESCSHDDRAAWVARRSKFFSYAQANAVDFRIASAVMADPSYPELGVLLHGPGNPKVLTPASNLATEFEAKVFDTPDVSPTEACLDPALRALSAPLIANENTWFLRREAALSILCLADEIEQSPQPWTFYVDALRNLKGNGRAPVTVSTITWIGTPGDLNETNYVPIVEATGGELGDMFTSDWDSMVKQVGDRVFGARSAFPLSVAPDPQVDPVVRIDGVPLPKTGAQGGTVWALDPVGNAITFDPAYAPTPGKRLEISYPPVCHLP